MPEIVIDAERLAIAVRAWNLERERQRVEGEPLQTAECTRAALLAVAPLIRRAALEEAGKFSCCGPDIEAAIEAKAAALPPAWPPVELNEEHPSGWSIAGPYHYAGDVWPCFAVRSPDRIVASFFIVSGDYETAERQAVAAVAALIGPRLTPPGEG